MATSRRKASRGTSRSGVGAAQAALTPDALRAKRAELAKQHDDLLGQVQRANEQLLAMRGAINFLDSVLTEASDDQ